MGEAIVLVDGLDEAGGDLSRHRVSLAIQTFRSAYPQCPLWVTSRVYGYTHDVRLPTDDFSHYRVGRLEPLQIDDFVERWYVIQYPENERERQEQVNSLQNALRRNPSVQRLAGNPLLLTLMAFIHYGQRTLPQDRGELYEQCIQMLLKSWLEAKRKAASAAGNDAPHGNEIIGLRRPSRRNTWPIWLYPSKRRTNPRRKTKRGLIRRSEPLTAWPNGTLNAPTARVQIWSSLRRARKWSISWTSSAIVPDC